MSELEQIEFLNADPRCPCLLLLDASGSMAGAAISALNEGLRIFEVELKGDELASRRVEVAIVTFGPGGVQSVQDFVVAANFSAPTLTAGGNTPMGHAIATAIGMIRDRKRVYKQQGVAHYRPWIFMITDGGPTDSWKEAAAEVHQEEEAKGLAFFAVGTQGANMTILAQISVRAPMALDGIKFRDLFVWLSQSQKRVSASKVGDQIPLSPIGWSAV